MDTATPGTPMALVPASSPARAAASSSSCSSPNPLFSTGRHKSCDACKARKVKCPNVNYPAPCANCIRRKTPCRFGVKKVPRRNVSTRVPPAALHTLGGEVLPSAVKSPASSPLLRYVDTSQPRKPGAGVLAPAASHTDKGVCPYGNKESTARSVGDAIPMFYIDHMLARAQHQNLGKEYTPLSKGNGIFGGSYSLTFFSESRLLSLSSRLRNNRVNELVHRINGVIGGRLRRTEPATQESMMLPITPMATTIPVPAAAAAAAVAGSNSNSSGNSGQGHSDGTPALPIVDPPFAAACIRCYFDNVHAHYPFLDQASFERRAADPDLSRSLANSCAWSSLYHAVLAIGCPYTDGGDGDDDDGNFEPGKGTAWRLFSVALSHFPALLILPDSLITLQALTAMAVYGLGVACLSIERVLLSEAARRAQSLAATASSNSSGSSSSGTTGVNPASSTTFQRTFWVVYGIEKVMSFHYGRSSSFADGDISCPLPVLPTMSLDDGNDDKATGDEPSRQKSLDWFLLWIRHARLLSRTYTWLFSVGTSCNSAASRLATIDQLAAEVEEWRLSIPDVRGLRPQQAGSAGSGPDSQPAHRQQRHWLRTATSGASGATSTTDTAAKNGRSRSRAGATHKFEQTTTLMLNFLYHSYMLILTRARLRYQARLPAHGEESDPHLLLQQQTAGEQVITSSCRAILERTPAIEVEPYTPLWILAVAPLSSLLVLFDFVIHHPTAPDAAAHLVLLDMGAGYFSRIEYTSGGTLPGSLVSEFVHIARDYVNGRHYGGGDGSGHSPRQQHQRQQPLPIMFQQPIPPPPSPLPPPPPPPSLSNLARQQDEPPVSLVDTSTLAAMDWSTVAADAAAVPGTLGGPSDGGDVATGYGDSFGYDGYAGPDTGAGDFSGTNVLGLFSYLLPEMDAMLYQGLLADSKF